MRDQSNGYSIPDEVKKWVPPPPSAGRFAACFIIIISMFFVIGCAYVALIRIGLGAGSLCFVGEHVGHT